jgi:hypothetical protein
MALYYKELGPQKTTYSWETENDDDAEIIPIEIVDETEIEEPLVNESIEENSIVNPTYNYTFKPKEEN